MAANTAPVFTAVANVQGIQFANADGTTKKTLFTSGANGSRIDGVMVCSNDSVDRSMAFYINDGTSDHYIGAVAVPLGSGYTTVARVNAMAILAPPSVGSLILPTGYTLKCNMVVAVTSSDVVDVTAAGGNY